MAEAVSFSSVIVMPVPSFAQELLFKAMLPHLSDQHIIMLMPGNYGSLVLSKLKDELGYEDLSPTFVDAITIPWACRIAGDAEIAIMGIKEYLPLAALPASRTGEMIEALSAYFPLPLTAVDNVLAAGLENINFGGHPLLTTLNMGLLENFNGDFNYYKDCCSPATARAAAMMEQERIAVGEALGKGLTPELEAMNGLYGLECESVYELNRTSETHGKITSAPDSSRHRYITEDVPYLLAPCHQLAQLGELPVPLISSCLHIAGAYNGVDYFTEGRSLEEMGLAEMSIEQIKAFVS
jgi:opine dehydrogenase